MTSPRDGNEDTLSLCDIGAFERAPNQPPVADDSYSVDENQTLKGNDLLFARDGESGSDDGEGGTDICLADRGDTRTNCER